MHVTISTLTKCKRNSHPGDEHMKNFRYLGMALTK